MQTIIQVTCTQRRGDSLRQRIVHDESLGDFGLRIQTRRVVGRNPGWAKVLSTEGYAGAVNIEWDSSTNTLLARVVTRRRSPAGRLVGQFISYVLSTHGRHIRAITVLP
jgi:hypothetical protein